ncbi:hypothetical protein, partial [Salibacterium lacus]
GILYFGEVPLRQHTSLLLQSTREASIRRGSSCLLCTRPFQDPLAGIETTPERIRPYGRRKCGRLFAVFRLGGRTFVANGF